MVIAGFALVLFGLSYQVNPLIAQTAVSAWEQVSVSELLNNPSNYAGHLVRTNGYVITNTGAYFGGKYSLYEAVHEAPAVIPTDPNVALSWSGTVDPLANYISGWYDGQTISCNPPCPPCANPPCQCPMLCIAPRMVWIAGNFMDRGQIADAPQYIIIVGNVSWYETTTVTTMSTTACTLTITVTLTSGQPYPPLALLPPGACYAFVTVNPTTTQTSQITTITQTVSTTTSSGVVFPLQLPTQPAAVASTSVGIILLIIGIIMLI